MEKKFDAMTLVGLLIGIGGIVVAYKVLAKGKMSMLVGSKALEGILIVWLGTFSATIVGQSWKKFTEIPKLIAQAYNPAYYNVRETIDQFVNFAAIARKDGVLALEKELPNIKEPFFKK